MHTTHSKSKKPMDLFSSETSSEHLKIEPAVMASEIERLPDLAGFLKLASVPDWQAVRLAPMSTPAPVRPRRPSIMAPPPAPRAEVPPVSAPATPKRPRRPNPVAAKQRLGGAE